jgi:hypothetical protein
MIAGSQKLSLGLGQPSYFLLKIFFVSSTYMDSPFFALLSLQREESFTVTVNDSLLSTVTPRYK